MAAGMRLSVPKVERHGAGAGIPVLLHHGFLIDFNSLWHRSGMVFGHDSVPRIPCAHRGGQECVTAGLRRSILELGNPRTTHGGRALNAQEERYPPAVSGGRVCRSECRQAFLANCRPGY
jgi:hypothetical protein